MRLLTMLCVFITCAITAQVPDNSPEAAIRDALRPNSEFYGSGIMYKQLSRMGDAAAVAITKVVAGGSVDSLQIDRLLTIIQMAFSAPRLVNNEQTEHLILRSLY